MSDEKKKTDSFRALSLRGKFAKEQKVNEASTAAREALAGVQHVSAELTHKCGDVTEAKAQLTEAEGVLAHLTDGNQKVKLEEALRRARAAVEESEKLCRSVQRR